MCTMYKFWNIFSDKNNKNCNLFTREALRVLMNSFKRLCAFQIELEFGSVSFEERG